MPIHFEKRTLDATGMSQTRIGTTAMGCGIEAIASAALDLRTGQWRCSVRFSPPPDSQEGWPQETFEALSAVVAEATTEAARLRERRAAGSPGPRSSATAGCQTPLHEATPPA